MSEGLFLNLGCGGQIVDGWINVERPLNGCGEMVLEMRQPDLRLDITESWPWSRATVDGIVLHHVLDLFTAEQMEVVLQRAHRVMKLGAVLRVSGADIDMGIEMAMAGIWNWFAEPQYRGFSDGHFREPDVLDREATLGFFITQGGARKQHLLPSMVKAAIEHVGFLHAKQVEYQFTLGPPKLAELDARPSETWFVEAIR